MVDLNEEGNRLRLNGNYVAAAAEYHKSLSIATAFDCDDTALRAREFQALFALAEMYYLSGTPEEAAPYCDRGVVLAERLTQQEASDPLWRSRLGYAHMLEGRDAIAHSEWKLAARSFREVERLRRGLVNSELDNSRYQRQPRRYVGLSGLVRAKAWAV